MSTSWQMFFAKTATFAGALISSYFIPIQDLLITCFLCTIIDMYYGVKRVKIQGAKILSKKNWFGTIWKLRDEWIIIALAHFIERSILGQHHNFILSGGVTAIIALTELWSILENLNTINPDGPWKILGKFLKKKGEDYIGISIDELQDEQAKRKINGNSDNCN